MPKTIRAIFEHGLFRPTEPVDLPDPCQVEVEVRARLPASESMGTTLPPPANWDEVFATKLVLNSAPPVRTDELGLRR